MMKRAWMLCGLATLAVACLGVDGCNDNDEGSLIKIFRDEKLVKASPWAEEKATFSAEPTKLYKKFEAVKDVGESIHRAFKLDYDNGEFVFGSQIRSQDNRVRRYHLEVFNGERVSPPFNMQEHGFNGINFDKENGVYVMVDRNTILIYDGEVRKYQNVYRLFRVRLVGNIIYGLSVDWGGAIIHVFDLNMKLIAKEKFKEIRTPDTPVDARLTWDLAVNDERIYIIPPKFNVFFVVSHTKGELVYEGSRKWYDSEALDIRGKINIAIEKKRIERDRRTLGFGFVPYNVIEKATIVNGELFGWVSASRDPNSPQYLLHLHGDTTDVIALAETGLGKFYDWVPVWNEGKLEIYALHHIPGGNTSLVRYFNHVH